MEQARFTRMAITSAWWTVISGWLTRRPPRLPSRRGLRPRAMGQRSSSRDTEVVANLVLPNLALWDQGAPPVAARSARRPGNVDRIHRGTAGCRSAHAGRPARRCPRAGDGSATTGGARMSTRQQLPRPPSSNAGSPVPRALTRRSAMAAPPLTPPTRRYVTACTRERERCRQQAGAPTTCQQHAPVNSGQRGHPRATRRRRSGPVSWR